MDDLPTFGTEIVCCLLIETTTAVEKIDAILAVNGVDLATVAPFALSTSLGVSGQFQSPVFIEAVRKIEAAARSAQIPLGAGRRTPRPRSTPSLHGDAGSSEVSTSSS